MFTYDQYLAFKDNPHVSNCFFKCSDNKMVRMPAIDIINNSQYFADEIAGSTEALEFSVDFPADTLELLIKMLYTQKITEVDIKPENFLNLVVSTYVIDFTVVKTCSLLLHMNMRLSTD